MHDSGTPLELAVLFGGRSAEHEISLRSARAVIGHLDRQRYRMRPVGITREGGWLPEAASRRLLDGGDPGERGGPPALPAGVQCALPVLHGPGGEDGTVQGWLALLGVPFAGSDCTGSALAMDKALAKHVLRSARIPVVPWTEVDAGAWPAQREELLQRIEDERGYPCFVKPARLGSSVGITRAEDRPALAAALDEALRHGPRAVVEPAMEGRELEVAVLDGDPPVVSLPGEIRTPAWYDYEAKYVNDDAELLVPAPDFPAALADHLRELSLRAFRALRLSGFARVDFLMDRKAGRVALNEVNTIPGFTSISMFPKLMEHAGVGFPELLDRLVDDAMKRAGSPAAPARPGEAWRELEAAASL